MHINIAKVNFKSIGINIAKVDFGLYDSGGVEYYGMYITPAGDSAISVTPNSSYYTLHSKYLKYSFDGKNWNDWNGSVTIEHKKKMYLKGEDDYVWNSSTSGKLITSDGYYNVGGDISSLTNGIVEVKGYTFRSLFNADSYIKDASKLIFPATALAPYCYNGMFQGCTSLTAAPALPATTLADSCYKYMFGDCTALTTAPELPTTKLGDRCYYRMFEGCTALKTAPELPATTLTPSCYQNMFSGCTSLTTAPALPATTLSNHCCRSMFSGCTSLTTAPALPATVLTESCYSYMFYNCTSLTTAPELPATTLTPQCYQNMFNRCTSLTTAPALPATVLTESCYSGMFYNCKKLNNITMLATDISATDCMENWVSGVSSTGTFIKSPEMTTLPTGTSGIPSGWTVLDDSDYLTLSALGDGTITITIPTAVNSTCATSLSYSKDKSSWVETIVDDTDQTITIPVSSGEDVYLKGKAKQWGYFDRGIQYNTHIGLSTNIIASGNIMSLLYGDDFKGKTVFPAGSQYTFDGLFKGNSHLINVENLILPATTLASDCYSSMFEGCTSLITAPELPATELAESCYFYMFYGCTSLTTAPALPATTLASSCYSYMFYNCTSLATAPALPATTLVKSCYSYMFEGCTSLTTAPELPATTFVLDCYRCMFRNCSSLNNITMLATDISVPYCLFDWVYGVSSTGTFTKATSMTSLPEGASGIPSGWTVVNK